MPVGRAASTVSCRRPPAARAGAAPASSMSPHTPASSGTNRMDASSSNGRSKHNCVHSRVKREPHSRHPAGRGARADRPGDRQGAGPRRARRVRGRGRQRRARLGLADGPRRRRRDGARALEGVDRRHAADARASSTSSGCDAARPDGRRVRRPARRRRVFPGAGGMPIARDGVVVAGIAASGATVGPFVDYPGADRRKLIADGKPANCRGPARPLRARDPVRGPARRRRAALARRLRGAARRARAGDGRSAAGLQPEHEWARGAGRRAIGRGDAARRARRRRGRRPPRRPDPAGLHGRRADRRAVRRRGGRRRRGDVPGWRARRSPPEAAAVLPLPRRGAARRRCRS